MPKIDWKCAGVQRLIEGPVIYLYLKSCSKLINFIFVLFSSNVRHIKASRITESREDGKWMSARKTRAGVKEDDTYIGKLV